MTVTRYTVTAPPFYRAGGETYPLDFEDYTDPEVVVGDTFVFEGVKDDDGDLEGYIARNGYEWALSPECLTEQGAETPFVDDKDEPVVSERAIVAALLFAGAAEEDAEKTVELAHLLEAF